MEAKMTILALWAALFFSCTFWEPGAGGSASESSPLVDLSDFDQFVAAFDDGRGTPRLVLLLSPT